MSTEQAPPPQDGHGLGFQLATQQEIEAGKQWLREYLEASGQKRFVIGLSGGVDSATVAYWALKAVGVERVSLISMPYGLREDSLFGPSSDKALEYPQLVAQDFPEMDFEVLDIASTVDHEAQGVGLAGLLEQHPDRTDLKICLANIKARTRAMRLRYFANRHQGLVLGTENRSEYWMGYFTRGGDEQSDLEVLADFYKTEVWQLAKQLGVPAVIRQRSPSADLWQGQTDEGELGFGYRAADPVIAALVGEASETVLEQADPELVEKVRAQMEETAFKRVDKPHFQRRHPPTIQGATSKQVGGEKGEEPTDGPAATDDFVHSTP